MIRTSDGTESVSWRVAKWSILRMIGRPKAAILNIAREGDSWEVFPFPLKVNSLFNFRMGTVCQYASAYDFKCNY